MWRMPVGRCSSLVAPSSLARAPGTCRLGTWSATRRLNKVQWPYVVWLGCVRCVSRARSQSLGCHGDSTKVLSLGHGTPTSCEAAPSVVLARPGAVREVFEETHAEAVPRGMLAVLSVPSASQVSRLPAAWLHHLAHTSTPRALLTPLHHAIATGPHVLLSDVQRPRATTLRCLNNRVAGGTVRRRGLSAHVAARTLTAGGLTR